MLIILCLLTIICFSILNLGYKFLKKNGKRYREQGSSKDKRGQINNAVSIDERPAIVEEKNRLGDW